MRAIRRILVAVKDPKARSLPAVAKAAQLARAFGAQIELFHSISSLLYVDAYGLGDGVMAIERETVASRTAQLERVAARVRERKVKVAVRAVWDYPVHEAIVRRARQFKADLIVSERHAGLHIAPGLLRLTDWELLRWSPAPVLLVKRGGTYNRPVVLAAIDPGHAHAKPLRLDADILQASEYFASVLHGSVHAVHAYIPIGVLPYSTVAVPAAQQLDAQARAEAQRRLDTVLTKSPIRLKNRHLVAREPIFAIDQVARETHSSIVVMGALSRSGLKRLFIGNTAEGVLDYLPSDLLILKPRSFVAKVQAKVRGVRYNVSPVLQGLY
ncbi:MAG TPA: universal stress protein [Steroidobacteraceae bacterium]|nr:universal stress protein [Steroidobacteraceae bacterium]